MRTLMPSLLFGSLTFMAIIWINANHPEMIDGVMSSLRNEAISSQLPSNKEERARMDRINGLLISERNKEDLRNGRPFWDAAPHMVELAFGVYADDSVVRVKNNTSYEFQTYSFGAGADPIVAEFQNSKLACMHYPNQQQSLCNDSRVSYYKSIRDLRKGYPFNL